MKDRIQQMRENFHMDSISEKSKCKDLLHGDFVIIDTSQDDYVTIHHDICLTEEHRIPQEGKVQGLGIDSLLCET